jgi:hypothetical protein
MNRMHRTNATQRNATRKRKAQRNEHGRQIITVLPQIIPTVLLTEGEATGGGIMFCPWLRG